MLKLNHISKIYHNKNSDVKALDDINLKFSNQGMTFIIGSSGCGKTTLLNIIAGNDKEYDGEVLRDGKVESIEQEIQLLENLSILDNLLLVTDDKEEVQKLLHQFKLLEPNKKVKKLSGGERKRVQIIRSLLSKATYLICDEPTASLDHENSEMIMDLLKEVSKNIGVIVVTHDIALVEKYKDRVIKMGKGCILEDEVCVKENTKGMETASKRTLNKQMTLLFKMMKSRIGEMMFRYILLFFSVLTVFVMISLFPSLNESVKAATNWLEGKNVVVVSPVDKENSESRNVVMGGKLKRATLYRSYDLYHQQDVYLMHDNIEGIIGYRIGWDDSKFMQGHDTSFYPIVTFDELQESVNSFREEYESTGIEPYYGYQMMYDEVVYFEENHDKLNMTAELTFVDYSHNYGFKTTLPKMIDSYDNEGNVSKRLFQTADIPFNQSDVNLDHMHPIVPYQLFPGVKLDLVVGKMPEKEDEILVTMDLGDTLMIKHHLSSLEELVGEEVDFVYFQSPSGKEIWGQISSKFKVCGVTYMDSKFQDQIFGIDGAFDCLFVEEYGYQADVVAYQYIDFLLDPKMDSEKIAKQMNGLTEPKDSEFVVYGNIDAILEGYQDPMQIIIFAGFALSVLIALYLVMHLLMNQRMKKENKIMVRYQYQPLIIHIVMMLILLVAVSCVQYLMLPYVCDYLNQLANSIGMANIVEYNIGQYMISLTIVGIVVVVLEGGLYAFRTKEHS